MSLFDWLNRHVAPWITAAGFTPRSVTLEVRGRSSGRPIRLSMSPSEVEGRQYLVVATGSGPDSAVVALGLPEEE